MDPLSSFHSSFRKSRGRERMRGTIYRGKGEGGLFPCSKRGVARAVFNVLCLRIYPRPT